LAIAVALLVVTLWLAPSMNKASTKELNMASTASQLRLSSISLSPQEANQQANVDVYGEASNAGAQPITNAIISAVFKDKSGNVIVTQQKPMTRVELQKKTKAPTNRTFRRIRSNRGNQQAFARATPTFRKTGIMNRQNFRCCR